MDHDTPAAPPPARASPPQEDAAPDFLGRAAARLRATPPFAIVAAAFLVAVFAGIGVTGIEYWVHAQSVRGRALADFAVAPAQPPALASPAAPPVVAEIPPAPAAEATAPTVRRSAPAARKAASARTLRTPKSKPVKEVRKSGVAVAAVEPRASEAPTKPATLDERYADAARKKCRSGALGLPCREMVRWRMCRGRWNDGRSPGETSCYVQREESAFPPLVMGALHCPALGN